MLTWQWTIAWSKSPQVTMLSIRKMATLVVSLVACGAAVAQPAGTEGSYFIYNVTRGDTLFELADRYMDRRSSGWHELQTLNRVSDPWHMKPGTRIRIPLDRIPVTRDFAKIVFVRGDVLAGSVAAQVGMQLAEGAEIITSAGSSATLEFSDGSRVTVPVSSIALIKRARFFTKSGLIDTVIEVKQGAAESRVAPRGTGVGRFEMRTPTMVTGVRGTRFRVETQQKSSQSTVFEGNVRVGAAASGRVLDYVRAGYGISVDRVASSSRTAALLPEPVLGELPARVLGPSATIAWNPVKGARAYRVVVASDQMRTEWLSEQIVQLPRIDLTNLPEGTLSLVVSAIDANNLSGNEAVKQFMVKLNPPPPFTLEPQNESTLFRENVSFQWAEVPAAAEYDFELSQDPAFLLDVKSIRHRGSSLVLPLVPGHWTWRVRSVEAEGDPGPWGEAVAFTVHPAPPVPTIDDSGNSLRIRWTVSDSSGSATQSYRLQMASDEKFEHLVNDTIISTNEITMRRPAAGTYYTRVAVIYGANQRDATKESTESSFSPPQRIELFENLRDTQGNAVRVDDAAVRLGKD